MSKAKFNDPEKLEALRREKTLVLIKPDAVTRHIVGELITRFERKGLKIVAMKMVWADQAMTEAHYTDSEEWINDTGPRTYESYIKKGMEPPAEPRELALRVRAMLMESLRVGPVVAMVLEGSHVIETVRKMRGATSPQLADVGTIGFDYSTASYELSDAGDYPVRNIIHASDSQASVEREVPIWFKSEEIMDHDTAITKVAYRKDWHKN
jgi:nucleoside-diphosphate kinase